MEAQPAERRHFSRVDFEAEACIKQEDNIYSTRLLDISLNGALVATPDDYEIRTDIPCTLTVCLADDVVVSMQMVLVHSSSRALGFHCTGIDIDSMTHLRRLIEINLSDSTAADRVLNEMLKSHKG